MKPIRRSIVGLARTTVQLSAPEAFNWRSNSRATRDPQTQSWQPTATQNGQTIRVEHLSQGRQRGASPEDRLGPAVLLLFPTWHRQRVHDVSMHVDAKERRRLKESSMTNTPPKQLLLLQFRFEDDCGAHTAGPAAIGETGCLHVSCLCAGGQSGRCTDRRS